MNSSEIEDEVAEVVRVRDSTAKRGNCRDALYQDKLVALLRVEAPQDEVEQPTAQVCHRKSVEYDHRLLLASLFDDQEVYQDVKS